MKIYILALIKGFLARREFLYRNKILFCSKIEKCDTLWFCKLIKFGKHKYSLTVRLAADSHQQMIKKFKMLPFKDEDAGNEVPECLQIIIKNDEWVDIDLGKSSPQIEKLPVAPRPPSAKPQKSKR